MHVCEASEWMVVPGRQDIYDQCFTFANGLSCILCDLPARAAARRPTVSMSGCSPRLASHGLVSVLRVFMASYYSVTNYDEDMLVTSTTGLVLSFVRRSHVSKHNLYRISDATGAAA